MNLGTLGVNFEITGKTPSKFIPMMIIKKPAIITMIPCVLPDILIAEPNAPAIPPITVYEIILPELYRTPGRNFLKATCSA